MLILFSSPQLHLSYCSLSVVVIWVIVTFLSAGSTLAVLTSNQLYSVNVYNDFSRITKNVIGNEDDCDINKDLLQGTHLELLSKGAWSVSCWHPASSLSYRKAELLQDSWLTDQLGAFSKQTDNDSSVTSLMRYIRIKCCPFHRDWSVLHVWSHGRPAVCLSIQTSVQRILLGRSRSVINSVSHLSMHLVYIA